MVITDMNEVQLGTIGSGTIVRSILKNVAKTDGIRLAAVYSRSEQTGKALAAEYGPCPVYTDMDAFLQNPEVNTIYIATPNTLHYEQTKKALLAGKHVICEKPFCIHTKQAQELIKLADERNLLLVEAAPTTFLPNYEILVKELPKIGRIRLVMSNYSQYSSRIEKLWAGELPNIFNPDLGGGCLMDINFYNVYLNTALFGKPQKAVYYPNLFPIGDSGKVTDTSGLILLQYDDFTSTNAGAKDTWGVNYFQIEGEKGYIYIEDGSNGLRKIRVVTQDSDDTFDLQPDPDRWFYEVQALARLFLAEDRDALEKRNMITLNTIQVLEEARASAGLF